MGMKRLLFLSLIAVCSLLAVAQHKGCGCCSHSPADLKVMSFNVRYDNPADKENNWKFRVDRVANAIMFYDADIVGTQEVLYNQLTDLKERVKGYRVLGVGREDGKRQGEYAALWYKSERFELVDSGNFWLSQTPDVAGSLGWDGACVRIATWAMLRDRRSGRELLAMNTHLDHVGVEARREGVALILDRIGRMRGDLPVVLTGDFNSTPDSDVVARITGDSVPNHLIDTREVSPLVYGPAWSYHEWGSLPEGKRTLIDYVFIGGPLTVKSYGVLSETDNGRWLSDHCPVIATMVWGE